MQFRCLPDVSHQFVQGLSLSEEIRTDSTGTPKLSVVVCLDAHEHCLLALGIQALRVFTR